MAGLNAQVTGAVLVPEVPVPVSVVPVPVDVPVPVPVLDVPVPVPVDVPVPVPVPVPVDVPVPVPFPAVPAGQYAAPFDGTEKEYFSGCVVPLVELERSRVTCDAVNGALVDAGDTVTTTFVDSEGLTQEEPK